MTTNWVVFVMFVIFVTGLVAVGMNKTYFARDMSVEELLDSPISVDRADLLGQTLDPEDEDFNVEFSSNFEEFNDSQERLNALIRERQDIIDRISQMNQGIANVRTFSDSTDQVVDLDNLREMLQARLEEIDKDISNARREMKSDVDLQREWQQEQMRRNMDKLEDSRRNAKDQQQRLRDMRRDQQQRLRDLRNR